MAEQNLASATNGSKPGAIRPSGGKSPSRNGKKYGAAGNPLGRPPYIAKHLVSPGDTLHRIAAQYYNSVAEDKWMAIYLANQRIIGANPMDLRPGQLLIIPDLADEGAD